MPGGVERSCSGSGVHLASYPGPSPPVLCRPALLGWWREEMERGPGSLWQLLYPGSHSGAGRLSWSPEFESRSTALVEPSRAIAGRPWRVIRAWAWAGGWEDMRAVLVGVLAAQVQHWGQLLGSLLRYTLERSGLFQCSSIAELSGRPNWGWRAGCKELRR